MKNEKKWNCVPENDKEKRYVLETKESEKPLIFIGINPSTADQDGLDNTTKRITKIAENSGYDGWIMLNICPLRYTNPKDLKENYNNKYTEENLGKIKTENIKQIKEIVNRDNHNNIVCAWGNSIELIPEFEDILNELKEILSGKNIYYLKSENKKTELTAKKHPRHPLGCSSKSKLKEFENFSNYEINTKNKVVNDKRGQE